MAKSQVCKKVFVLKDGTEVRSAASTGHNAADVDRLDFRFAHGVDRKILLSDFPEADIILAATWYGLSQKLGDAYSGATKSESDPVELFDAVMENLVGGMWTEKGEGGETAPSLLIEAVMAALEKAGTPGDHAKVSATLSPRDADGNLDKPAAKKKREGTLANPAIKAEYERIKAERAAKRAKDAAAAAKGAGKEEATAGLADFV